MKRISIVFLLVLVSISLNAQYNLVPNSSFEVFDTCPSNGNQLYRVINWVNPIFNSSPDYLNMCGTTGWSVPSNDYGYELAHFGVAYISIINGVSNALNPIFNNYREYVEVELTDSLKTGTNYCVRFYVSLCDSMKYSSNNFGIYFSPTLVIDSCSPCNLPFTPQIENPMTNSLNNKNGWVEITGNYVAIGGEKYIVIGNFRDSANTVVNYVGGTSQMNPFALYYVDDILVTPCDSLLGMEEQILNPTFRIYPNPNEGIFNVKSSNNNVIESIQIYDVFSQLIYSSNHINNSEIFINIQNKKQGVYILEIKTSYSNKLKYKLFKN